MKRAKIFQNLAAVLFGLFLFIPVSCSMIQDATASVTINLGGGARAISAEDRASAVFDVYFDGNLVGSRVSGSFNAEATAGTTIVVRLDAFVRGDLVATGQSSLYVQNGENGVTIILREIQPSSGGGGGVMPTQITIARFDTSQFCNQNGNNIDIFGVGDTRGITVSNAQDIQGTTFNVSDMLPEPTFAPGDTHIATFVGWVPNDDPGLLSKNVLTEFDGKTLIPGIVLDPRTITVSFNTSVYYKTGDSGTSTFDMGDAAGITMSLPDNNTTFAIGDMLPIPTFTAGTNNTASFSSWAIYAGASSAPSGTPSTMVKVEFDGVTLIPIINLTPSP